MSKQHPDLRTGHPFFRLVADKDDTSSGFLPSRQERNRFEDMHIRFDRGGADALNPAEHLEMLLAGRGIRRDASELAIALLDAFGDVPGVLSADHGRLSRIAGDVIARDLKLVAAAGRAMAQKRIKQTPIISCWDALISYCRTCMAGLTYEEFRVLFLDRSNRLIADERQGKGTVDHVPVYPREILKRALELDSCALILVHNHPSGDPTPSDTDIAMTKMIRDAADSLSITLHDHVIIGAAHEISMVSEGLI